MEECYPFLQNSEYIELTPEAWRLALDIQAESKDVFQTSYAIMDHVFSDFQYDTGATTVSTHASEVLDSKRGVCQDFAHAAVALCRSIKIPARYVSGYLRTYPPPGHVPLRGADASHAWISVFCGEKTHHDVITVG